MNLPSRLRLRARLTALGLIATLPALAVILYTQSLERARTRARIVESVRQLAQVAASQQAVLFDGVRRLLLTVSQIPSVRGADPAACEGLLRSILRDHPGYLNIWVMMPDGTPFCTAAPNPATASDNRARTWFQRAVAMRTTVVSDFQISILTGKPDVVLAHPLLTSSGAIERMLAAAVGIDQLNGIAAQERLPSGATLTLFDRQGRIVARVPDGDTWVGRSVPDAMRLATSDVPDGVRDIMGLTGRPIIYTTAPVTAGIDTGLGIGVGVDRDAAFMPSLTLLRQQLWLLLIVFVASVSAALIGGEWFVMRPISVVADVTRRLASGDFTARARLRRGVPGLADLATAVNAMAVELETRDTERRAAEDALHASEDQRRHALKLEAVGQLAAGIAHNFNNLLTVIVGFTELLLVRHRETAQDRTDLEAIDKAARRGATLTRQLLTFCRKHKTAPRQIDLNYALAEVQALLARVLREDIRLTIEPAPAPALIVIDPNDLEQVILNLVLNARDAQPTTGQIHIDVACVSIRADEAASEIQAPAGSYIRLRVRDTGVGMPPTVLAHLFEPFFTTKEVGQGTGLGLATIDGIVGHNRGFVKVDSTVGIGSTFSVYFPAVAPAPDADTAQAQQAPAPEPRGATILLVEDEAGVRAIATRTLERAGYRILAAATPSAATEIFGAHAEEIALVITDVVMPDMHGPALVAQLTARRPDLRVLFISGYSEEEPLLHSQGDGRWFLQKPFSPSELVATVALILAAPIQSS